MKTKKTSAKKVVTKNNELAERFKKLAAIIKQSSKI